MGIKSERFSFALGVIENEKIAFSGMHDRFDIRTWQRQHEAAALTWLAVQIKAPAE